LIGSKTSTRLPSGPNKREGTFRLIACVVCLLALCIFFRDFLRSHFDLIAGNDGDNRLNAALLEHWRTVFHGYARFTSPKFFWPEQDVLGYSDSLFLLSIPYILVRSFGFDQWIAFELALISFKTIGFFSMLWLLRSFVDVSRPVALVGCALFTVSNLYFLSTGHGQLMTVAFVPLLVGLACASWQACGRAQKHAAYLYSAAFGLLLALVLFTSFYIGWFVILIFGITIASAALVGLIRMRSSAFLQKATLTLVSRSPVMAAAILAFSLAIVPFWITYLPMLRKTGGRTYQEVLPNCSRVIDLLNIGKDNWMWGHSMDSLRVKLDHTPMVVGETQRGWPPLTLGLLVVSGFLIVGQRRAAAAACSLRARKQLETAVVLNASLLLGWALSLKSQGQSLWWLIFKIVPGGSAIRVPTRVHLVLNVLVVIIGCIVLDQVKERRSRKGVIAFWTISLVLIAEQINIVPSHLISRFDQSTILTRVGHPPSACRSFFLANPARPERPWYSNQIDAMWIEEILNLPTLNGYSGWLPADWGLAVLDSGYLHRVRRWALSKHIVDGLCGLNLMDESWRLTNFSATARYSLGLPIDFRAGGNADSYELEGWGEAEPAGSWTIGEHSVLLLRLPSPPTSDLVLIVKAHAFLPSQHPSFRETLRLNNTTIEAGTVTEPQFVKRLRLPQTLFRSGIVRIDFVNGDPRSPAELGLSADVRKLGLALESIEIKLAGSATAH
jgi:hypothetical protein